MSVCVHEGINVENFVSVTGWLLGPNAKMMIRMLPTVVGKIGLRIFEVERVSMCTVFRYILGDGHNLSMSCRWTVLWFPG